MRQIDADTLRAELAENFNGGYYTVAEICAIIDVAPTIGGWISVKDSLPRSVINKVLVYLDHDDLGGYIGYGHYENYQGKETWYDLEHSEPFAVYGYRVTHWMSLPEPPKEDDHG